MSSETATLEVTLRDTTKNPRQLRSEEITPATVYGKGVGPYTIQVPTKAFFTFYKKGQLNYTLSGLSEGPIKARAHQVQMNPITQEVLSIEFWANN